MDFLLAIIIAWLGANPAPGVAESAVKHFSDPSRDGKSIRHDVQPHRPDPGKSYGPIIIIDDTHFKKHKEK